MSATAKIVFVFTVALICVLLLLCTTKTSKKVLLKSKQRRYRPYSNLTATNDAETLVWSQLSPATTVSQQCHPVRVPISVLGRQPERCVTGEDDVHISIKTTRGNYKTRLPILLLTWLQSVRPEQVQIVTDILTQDEEIYQITSALGINILPTKCNISHHKDSLCCKAGMEYLQYYNKTENQSKDHLTYKWFCHFDDDMYANIPNLMSALRRTGNESDDGVYFGRWPRDRVHDRVKKGMPINPQRLLKAGIKQYNETKLMVKWATGAAYCISASLMEKLKQNMFREHTYSHYCKELGLFDDLVPAVLAGALGYTITDNIRVKTHYDALKSIPGDQLKDLITISYRGPKKTVLIPNATFSSEEDPSRQLHKKLILPMFLLDATILTLRRIGASNRNVSLLSLSFIPVNKLVQEMNFMTVYFTCFLTSCSLLACILLI